MKNLFDNNKSNCKKYNFFYNKEYDKKITG